MSLTYRITTLGCRANHAEAREIESLLRARGLVPAARGGSADVEIVHTCSVTTSAAAKSRHAVRRAARPRLREMEKTLVHGASQASMTTRDEAGPTDDPSGPEVIVTGCYPATNSTEAHALVAGRGRVIPHGSEDDPGAAGGPASSMIERVAEQLDLWLAEREWRPRGDRAVERVRRASIRTGATDSSNGIAGPTAVLPLPMIPPAPEAGRHIRAEIKIQDGCDAHCTFCIIPTTRPTLRSKRLEDVVDEARRLVDLGHREIVLTGIFIGAYGHETALRRRQSRRGAEPLADLVDAVARVPGLARLRVSSMEPGDVTGPLLDAMIANAPIVVPHLHLPLQSGSDEILRRMNRQYRVGDYLEMIDQVQATLTDDRGLPPAITTDIICGFPGETDSDFLATLEVVERVQYLHLHVFPYSARPGTAAARWTDRRVPGETVRARVRRLIEREVDPENGLSIEFRRRLVGRTVRMILEQPDRSDPGCMTGRCDHYALLKVATSRPRGTLLNVTVTRAGVDETLAEMESAAVPLPLL